MAFGVTIPLSKIAIDDGTGPWAVVAVRFLTGGTVLAVVLSLTRRTRRASRQPLPLRPAVACATALAAGYVLLSAALEHTTGTAVAFISYLLVVIVPVISAVALRKPPHRGVVAGIVIATAGLLMLTGGVRSIGLGEVLALACAFAFSIHVLLLGRYSPAVESLGFAAVQLLMVGAITAPVALVVEHAALLPTAPAVAALVASGAAGGVALVLQQVGQRTVNPSRTSLILMIDPVVAAIGGYLLGERIGWLGTAGCAVILAGIAAGEALDPSVKERRR